MAVRFCCRHLLANSRKRTLVHCRRVDLPLPGGSTIPSRPVCLHHGSVHVAAVEKRLFGGSRIRWAAWPSADGARRRGPAVQLCRQEHRDRLLLCGWSAGETLPPEHSTLANHGSHGGTHSGLL